MRVRCSELIVAGTDVSLPGIVAGFSLQNESSNFAAIGFTPFEALKTATRNPAEFRGLKHDFGTVEAGMRADLVLLEGNPLQDIEQVRRIAGVMLNGQWISPGGIERRLEDLERAAAR